MDKLKQKIKEGNKPKRPSWWSRNGYKVWRVILFPVYLWILGFRAFEDWMVKRQKLDDKKDDEILSAFLAKRAEVDEGCLWYCTAWHYYSIRVDGWLKIKYRYYLKAFRRTLMDKFEKSWVPPMFARMEETDQFGDKWIKFIPEKIR